ncbi:MAG: DUF3696 domain-containing protein [Paludibacteraceae bacterium]|nr:DUF3696 domain-containing protein [Paludibacteraceae bacterium]
MVTRIEFENYRIFKQKQQFDIKPITIVFGKNNSGKTALLKLPSLVENLFKAFQTGGVVSPKNNGVRLFHEYLDLIYGRATNEVKLSVSFDDGQMETIGFHVDINKMVLDSIKPSNHTMNRVDYIGSIRLTEPDLDVRISNDDIVLSGIDGANMYQVLLKDSISDTPTVLSAVAQWYRDTFDGWYVDVDKSIQPVYNIRMCHDNGLKIPINDCGTGIIQSLPIVTRACTRCQEPTLIVLEEPETHLNPSAHADLCQLISKSVGEDKNKRYIIETHSQTFILRLQYLLAEGTLDVDDVAIYFVHFDKGIDSSILQKVDVKRDGSIPNWPKGMFTEVLEEAWAINRIRNNKK